MAYNQQQGGYGQYNPYGQQQQSKPYEQPYGHTGNYSERPDLEHHSSSRYDEESAQPGSYEMSGMNGRDPNRILNEVRILDNDIDQAERDLGELRKIQTMYLETTDLSESNPLRVQADQFSSRTMESVKNIVRRVGRIKQDPESQSSRNRAQVNKIERRAKATMNQFQQVDREFRKGSADAFRRQYLIVRPDASEAEVQEAVESGEQQVFSSALMSGNRRGEAQTAAGYVKTRHEDIQRIEKQMVELAQLFNDLEAMVVQQEPAVQDIEDKGAQATGHVAQANTELDGAVKKARSARRKKWMCLGIALLIIIIIVIVVVVVVEVTKK